MANDVDELLSSHSPEVRSLVEALRGAIHRAVPDARETVFGGWRLISYGFDASLKGQFCGIIPHAGHANVQFPQGVQLEDPGGLLRGSGKRSRHIQVRTIEEARSDALAALVRAAAALVRPAGAD